MEVSRYSVEATIEEGKIKCSLHGHLTGIDCKCLWSPACKGCFIYDAVNVTDEEDNDFLIYQSKELN